MRSKHILNALTLLGVLQAFPATAQAGTGTVGNEREFTPVDRFRLVPSPAVAMGGLVDIRIKSPLGKILTMEAYESDANGNFVKTGALHPQAASDGQSIVHVPALLTGKVDFHVVALYADYGIDSQDITLNILPPNGRPLGFWADESFVDGHFERLPVRTGHDVRLTAAIRFEIAPKLDVHLRHLPVYRILSGDGAPVIEADGLDREGYGRFKALRPGTAAIEADFGGVKAIAQIVAINPD